MGGYILLGFLNFSVLRDGKEKGSGMKIIGSCPPFPVPPFRVLFHLLLSSVHKGWLSGSGGRFFPPIGL
jgi:hypothetical protein